MSSVTQLTGSAPAPRRTGVGPRLGAAARLLVSLAAVLLLVRLVDFGAVGRTLATANPPLFGVALLIALADRALMIGKWFPLLRVQATSISLVDAARAYLAAGFASFFLPVSVGADVLRAVSLGRGRQAVPEVGASIVVERLLGVIASGLTAVLALLIAFEQGVQLNVLVPWALAAIALAVAVAFLPLSAAARAMSARWIESLAQNRWTRLLRRFAAAHTAYHAHTRVLGFTALLTLLEQGFPVLALWVLSRALDLSITLAMLAVAVPLALFLARMPIALGGVGLLEGGLVYLLSLFGVSATDALTLALGGRTLELITVLPGALWWSDLTGVRREPPSTDEGRRSPAPSAK